MTFFTIFVYVKFLVTLKLRYQLMSIVVTVLSIIELKKFVRLFAIKEMPQ